MTDESDRAVTPVNRLALRLACGAVVLGVVSWLSLDWVLRRVWGQL